MSLQPACDRLAQTIKPLFPETEYLFAASRGNVEGVKRWLDDVCVDPCVKDTGEVAKELFKKNGSWPIGLTALHFSVSEKHVNVVEAIVNHKRGKHVIDVSNNGGAIALHWLASSQDPISLQISQILLNAGAKTDLKNGELAPLDIAAQKGNIQFIKLLFKHERQSIINAQTILPAVLGRIVAEYTTIRIINLVSTGMGHCPLFCAVQHVTGFMHSKKTPEEDEELISLLLDNGADPRLKFNYGEISITDKAKTSKASPTIIELLEKAEQRLNEEEKKWAQ